MTNETARSTIQAARTASLGTITDEGHPFVSLVTVAATSPNTMAMLLSGLAKHTKYLLRDGRCSLLVADPSDSAGDPLAAARISLIGVATRLDRGQDIAERQAFLAKHPSASNYVDFDDFAFFRVEISEGHLVAGFGRIEFVSADQF